MCPHLSNAVAKRVFSSLHYIIATFLKTDFFYLYFHPSYCASWVHAVSNTCMLLCSHTHTVHRACSRPLISLLICLPITDFFTASSLSQLLTSHEWDSPPPWGMWVGGYTLPYCTPTSMHNFNNRPCHWNKSQASSGSGPSYANSNFISPRKLKQGN